MYLKLKTMENDTYSVIAPEISSIIDVYHPKFGSVKMVVVDICKNVVSCEFQNEEYSVRIRKITNFNNVEYRWEAEEL